MKLNCSVSGVVSSQPRMTGSDHNRVLYVLISTKRDPQDKKSHICGIRISGEQCIPLLMEIKKGRRVMISADGPCYATVWKSTGLPIIVVEPTWIQVVQMDSPHISREVTFDDVLKEQENLIE